MTSRVESVQTPLPGKLEQTIILFASKYRLSARETDVFRCLLQSSTTAEEIGVKLGVSRNTIRNHFQNIFGKTNTASKTELLAEFILTCSDTN